jgi:hypothetical protein
MGNRYVFNSEEAFIITLFRLTTGMTFTKMAQDFFGQDGGRLSYIIYNWMIQKFDTMCDGLFHGDSIRRWVPYLESWSALFQCVCKRRYNVQLNGAIRLELLMDYNGKEIMTPGRTCPMRDHPGAPRHPGDADVLQGGVYSGYT